MHPLSSTIPKCDSRSKIVFLLRPLRMYAHQLIVFYAGGLATCVHASGLLLRGHQVRQDTPTPCTSNAVETVATINRGNEGIWHVKANQTGVNELYQFTQTDWLGNNKTAVLNECTSICLTGNSAETPGTWLPSGKYFQGAFINTPGGSSQHPVWMCACYTNTLSMANLVAGGGVAMGQWTPIEYCYGQLEQTMQQFCTGLV
ncbi:hypothetical protein TruAng_003972 [Truncatella angustata]|nr:hypothetical protein TruAng_003972 [Truncatella angustata]